MDQTFSQFQQAGQLVSFIYTFSQRQIDFVYLEGDVAFKQLLDNPLIKIASRRSEYGVRTIYTLTNGMTLVQELYVLRNRYFLCKSEDDYSFILYHVNVYKEGDRLVIYGVSTNNAEMNEYLKREDPVELTRLSYINARVLKNKRGNIIIISVGYKRPVFDIKTPFKPLKEENKDYNFSDRSFLSCRIYQSMKDAKANSGLPHDEGGIDKDNFETVAKKQVIPQGHHIAVKIMNYSAGEELVKENANDVSELSNAGKSKAIALRKGGVIYRYSNMLFLVFPNTISFELYSNTYRQNLVSSKNTLSENINRRIIHFIKNGESHDLRTYFRLSPVDGNWKATLEDLDKKIEGYFYDELFLNLYFPEIVAYTGNVVLKQFDGKWKFNEADFSQPVSIVLKNGSELNFTKYLLKMFDDSNYNFPPSTYSVFETLIAISN